MLFFDPTSLHTAAQGIHALALAREIRSSRWSEGFLASSFLEMCFLTRADVEFLSSMKVRAMPWQDTNFHPDYGDRLSLGSSLRAGLTMVSSRHAVSPTTTANPAAFCQPYTITSAWAWSSRRTLT